MSKVKIRSAFSPSLKVPAFDGVTVNKRVKREFKKRVDINTIRKNMGIHQPRQWNASDAQYFRDMAQAPKSLQEAFDIVFRAEAAFEQLPLDFRRALDHNPSLLGHAPRELWEKHGLLKSKDSAEPNGLSPSFKADPPPGVAKKPSEGQPRTANKAPKVEPSNSDEE